MWSVQTHVLTHKCPDSSSVQQSEVRTGDFGGRVGSSLVACNGVLIAFGGAQLFGGGTVTLQTWPNRSLYLLFLGVLQLRAVPRSGVYDYNMWAGEVDIICMQVTGWSSTTRLPARRPTPLAFPKDLSQSAQVSTPSHQRCIPRQENILLSNLHKPPAVSAEEASAMESSSDLQDLHMQMAVLVRGASCRCQH